MTSPNNLPLQLTSFIGREREIAEIKRLLATSRLLTLAGAGGSGKTRLALQVASHLSDEYPDGMFFVNLAPITDPNLVVSTIAQTLDVKEAAGQPLIETLKKHLADKEILILLDNFEQVVKAATLVVDLLMTAPHLRVMITSREPLHMQGEQQFLVPPLSVPHPGQPTNPLALSQYEAVMLFLQRAQAARADFELTEDNAPSISEICIRLDGLPLAIELAAARINLLPPQAMISRLNSRLKLLTGGAHDLPARQQTLRNTIDWSYDLLGEAEQQLFRRLAVFQGGRTLQGIEAVCNADGQLEVDVEQDIESLLGKNLLQQRDGSDGEPRFWMLETIHEYAREKLQESGEVEHLQREHALYFMRLAEEAEPHLTGHKQQEWMVRVEEEHDNLRAALRWAMKGGSDSANADNANSGNSASNTKQVEVGLRTGGALYRFWLVRGYWGEGRNTLEALLTRARGVVGCSAEVMAKALNVAGVLSRMQGDNSTARSLFEESLALYRELGDKKGIALSLASLGNVARMQGDNSTARSLYEESLALRRELGDKRGIANSLINLGIVAQKQGDYSTARSLHTESQALSRELGDKGGIATSLISLGIVAHMQGDYSTARSLYEESLALSREIGHKGNIAVTLGNICNLEYSMGEYGSALSHYKESLLAFREMGDKHNIAFCLGGVGGARAQLGQTSQTRQTGDVEKEVKEGVEEVERGARLLGAAEALLKEIGSVLDPVDRIPYDGGVSNARSVLGEERFERLRQEGQGMSMEQAIAYALEDMSEPEANIQSLPSTTSYPYELTKREVEVLHLLVEGLTNEQIAQRLFLSTNTVRSHLHSVYSKINVGNRGAAARFAIEHSLT